MATAFDSIGMGQLGSEKRFMTQSNPFSEALKGIKDFAILSAIDKSGLAGWLNTLGEQNQALKDKYKSAVPAGAAVPDQPYAIKPIMAVDPNAMAAPYMQPPVISSQPTTAPVQPSQTEQKSLEDLADEAMGIKKSSLNSTINVGQDEQSAEAFLNRASQPMAYPAPMNLPQYGNQGGGNNSSNILSTIATLFA